MYCPKCGSQLYPDDERYMRRAGVCSYCVTCDSTPDKRYKAAYLEGMAAEEKAAKRIKKARK